jgi:septal ring factor EnvC (AmiA/AmiB activator)
MTNANTLYREKTKQAGPFLGMLAAGLTLVLIIVVLVLGVKIRHLNASVADTEKQLAQAKTDGSAAQTELAKVKAGTAGLQAELDKAKDQLGQVQGQLDMAKITATQLQAELDKARGSSTELLARLDADKTESAELRAQLAQATAGSTQQLMQLNQAKIQSMDLQARLEKAESDIAALQPLLLKSGHLPVTTSLEKTQGGRNFILHLTNLYPQPVSVDIAITGMNKTRSQHSIIGGSATQNVDKLLAGENIVITSEGYDPVKLAVQ